MADDRRRDVRTAATVPVRINGAVVGSTRDVSASGVYMILARETALGASLRFALELEGSNGSQLCLCCAGVVVRLEGARGARGMAVALDASELHLAEHCRWGTSEVVNERLRQRS